VVDDVEEIAYDRQDFAGDGILNNQSLPIVGLTLPPDVALDFMRRRWQGLTVALRLWGNRRYLHHGSLPRPSPLVS
jgi:hypothetical protein